MMGMFIKLAATVVLAAALAGTISTTSQRTALPSVEVFKSSTCGCCSKWVEHMRQAGFTVHTRDLPDADLEQMKVTLKVPDNMRSCHTARLGGYVVEGHIPAAEIKRLLKERLKVVGLIVPGMPTGSPGMEVPGVRPRTYQVLTFDTQGKTQVFSTQKP
jgi:hypothetical protein